MKHYQPSPETNGIGARDELLKNRTFSEVFPSLGMASGRLRELRDQHRLTERPKGSPSSSAG